MPIRSWLRNAAIQSTLEALYFTGASHLLRGRFGGVGVILTLHHVLPARRGAFQPNQSLEISPVFLDEVVLALRDAGLRFISLDELHRRLTTGHFPDRFACLTFDDGYRDVRQWAYPILRDYEVPFAIFITSDFADQRGHLWWRTLEEVVAKSDHVTIAVQGSQRTYICRTPSAKEAAVVSIHQVLSEVANEADKRAIVEELAARMGIDTAAQCAASCMDWTEIASLAADPLVTIGAHTVTHPHLRKLSPSDAWREMEASVTRIESALGFRPAHFAYPFGDNVAVGSREFDFAAKLGFKTAVTTRPDVIVPGDRNRLTSLPRISLNGHYQRVRYVRVLESGAATAVRNGLKAAEQARQRDASSTRVQMETPAVG